MVCCDALSSWRVPLPVFQKPQRCGSIMIVTVVTVALRTGGESKWYLEVTGFSVQICFRRKKKKKGISENISYLFKGQQKGYFLHKVVAMPNFKSGF